MRSTANIRSASYMRSIEKPTIQVNFTIQLVLNEQSNFSRTADPLSVNKPALVQVSRTVVPLFACKCRKNRIKSVNRGSCVRKTLNGPVFGQNNGTRVRQIRRDEGRGCLLLEVIDSKP